MDLNRRAGNLACANRHVELIFQVGEKIRQRLDGNRKVRIGKEEVFALA